MININYFVIITFDAVKNSNLMGKNLTQRNIYK